MKIILLSLLIISNLLSNTIGKDLFEKKCAGCHGVKAEKSALNSSAVIAGWSSICLEEVLNGYKENSYGAHLKHVMKKQLSKLKKRDMKLIINYVDSLDSNGKPKAKCDIKLK